MIHDQMVWEVIKSVVSEINKMLPKNQLITPEPETVIVGNGSLIDSLALLNFLILIEDNISNRIGKNISLVEHLINEGCAIQNLGNLATFIDQEIKSSK